MHTYIYIYIYIYIRHIHLLSKKIINNILIVPLKLLNGKTSTMFWMLSSLQEYSSTGQFVHYFLY